MIYVASPYTDVSSDVMQGRYQAVKAFTAALMRDGLAAYSPIVHGHDITSSFELPVDWAFWSGHCLGMLRKADRMIVFCLAGWERSVGVMAEIEFCESCGITVEYHYDVGGFLL